MTATVTLAFNLFLRQRRRIAFWVLAAVCLGLTVLPFVFVLIQRTDALREEGMTAELAVSGCGQAAVFALLLAVGLCQGSVSQDLTRSTVHLVLARPVSRKQYMAGMFLGSVMTSVSLYASFGLACFLGMAAALREHLPEAMLSLIILSIPVILLTLLVTLLSAWMPGSVAGIIGYTSFVFGLLSGALERVASGLHPFWGTLIRGANLLSLRLDRVFGMAGAIIRGESASWWPMAWEVGYALVILVAGVMLFERRKV